LTNEHPDVRILFAAGEVSGDRQAAHLVRALLNINPNTRIYGTGGEMMRQSGIFSCLTGRNRVISNQWRRVLQVRANHHSHNQGLTMTLNFFYRVLNVALLVALTILASGCPNPRGY